MLTCVKPPQSSPGSKGKRTQTRPGAVLAELLGCPGELEAQSRWVFKLARSSARCTPREGTKREKNRRPFGGGAPGGISIASRCCFPHGMQTRETHYLSFSASGGLLLTPRSPWISARSPAISNAKFCGRGKFSKISVGNPLKGKIVRNRTRRSMPTLGTVVGDL